MAVNRATLNGSRVTSGRVHVPAWGVWYAEALLDVEVTLTGAATLVVADQTFTGTILSGGPAKGKSYYRVVGGAGGWGKQIPKKNYANDLGVKFSSVIGDAAAAAGETLDTTTVDQSRQLGVAWTRKAGPACRDLELLSPSNWYVDVDGKTRIGQRASTTFAGVAPRVSQLDKAAGRLTLAPDSLVPFVPGVTVDGIQAVDVVHELSTKGGLRTTIYGLRGTAPTSRLASSIRAVLDQLDPFRAYRGIYEYRVVTMTGNRANLQTVLVSTGMPDLQRVPIRPGVSGWTISPALGSVVLVGFVNADPARPVVVGFEDADGGGFKPLNLSVDAQTLVKLGAGLLPVAKSGDFAGPFPIVTTQLKVLV